MFVKGWKIQEYFFFHPPLPQFLFVFFCGNAKLWEKLSLNFFCLVVWLK